MMGNILIAFRLHLLQYTYSVRKQKGTQLSWGVKTKPVELSKKLKQIWVALSILIWAVTLQKIDRTKVSGPKMRSKVKILIWNWWKLAKSTILLPGPNKCTHFQTGATTKVEEISKMLRCLYVALYMPFLVDPTTYPKFQIVFLLSQWQQKSFLAAKLAVKMLYFWLPLLPLR